MLNTSIRSRLLKVEEDLSNPAYKTYADLVGFTGDTGATENYNIQ